MAKAHLTDFTGAVIAPGAVIAYATRRGNTVRLSEAVVLECRSNHKSGRIVPMLLVQPTGRDSGFIRRFTRRKVSVAAQHVVVISE